MVHAPELIWRHGEIDVIYEPSVDGGGTRMVPSLIDFIRKRFGSDRYFDSIFEWGAGPGFIGFGLLAERMGRSLCLADINPKAIECVKRTIAANRLQNWVHAYVSNNMESVPHSERFDLVVGNPPSFYAPNPMHPDLPDLADNILAHDAKWEIHQGFYRQITPFLNPGALVLMLEVNLYDQEVVPSGCTVPLDVRPEAPHRVFERMICESGLSHIENAAFDPGWQIGLSFWVQISEKRA